LNPSLSSHCQPFKSSSRKLHKNTITSICCRTLSWASSIYFTFSS
jgi:hypothetical protein